MIPLVIGTVVECGTSIEVLVFPCGLIVSLEGQLGARYGHHTTLTADTLSRVVEKFSLPSTG